jgi:membrane-bound serine protease (ClpP class)
MKTRRSPAWLLAFLILLVVGPVHPEEATNPPSGPLVLRADLQNEIISPATARYVLRAMSEAESRGAECLILTLDTPGGLLESTRQLVKEFLNSRVCVVVYVYPTGSRAASAGVFITMAAHVAAMAPGTTIGAAHPVSIGGLPGPSEEESMRVPGTNLLRFLPVWAPGSAAEYPSQLVPEVVWLNPEETLSFRRTALAEGKVAEESVPAAQSDGAKSEQPATSQPGSARQSSIEQDGENKPGAQAGGSAAESEAAPGSPSKANDSSSQEKSAGKDADDKPSRSQSRRSPMEEKIINDTVSWARALAQERGRNADWIAKAVTESASITAEEAAENRVIDFVARDFTDLLEQLDGRTVKLLQGEKTLRTKGARVEKIEMWWGERLLTLVSHPQVAFLLLIFGFYGVLYELYSPGWGLPGTIGLICLLLGFFGLSVLPVNYLGLGLIAIALGLFVAEAMVASYGLLTLAGVVCMVLGGLMLIESPVGFVGMTLGVVLAVALATAFVTVLLVGAIIRAHRRQVLTGDESLAGREVQAKTDFQFQDGQYVGKVLHEGEWWQARSSAPIKQGETCRILRRDGLTLVVEPRQGAG